MTGLPPASFDGRRASRAFRGPVSAAVVLVLLSMAFLGCGTTRAPAVASVQGSTISQSTLDHWTSIKSVEAQNQPTAASPSPDQIRQKALAFLITAEWLQREAAAQRISVSAAEVDATYRHLLDGPAGRAFAATMKQRGLSSADERLQIRLAQLAAKLERKVASGLQNISTAEIAGYYDAHRAQYRRRGQTLQAATPAIREILRRTQRSQQISVWVAAYRQRWKQRTTCGPGYVIPECRNGPQLSASPVGG